MARTRKSLCAKACRCGMFTANCCLQDNAKYITRSGYASVSSILVVIRYHENLFTVKARRVDTIDSLKEQIQKTEEILAESLKNLEENPNDYSAKLLVMSTENYLVDLLRKMDEMANHSPR